MRYVLLVALLVLAPPARAAVDVQAHRGGDWGLGESSLASFREAIARGVPTIELDVQATPDRRLFVAHDADFDVARAPRLEEVLRLVRDASYPARLSAEIKRQRAVRGLDDADLASLVVDALERHGLLGRAIVQSFDPEVLAAVKELEPALPTAMLVRSREDFEPALSRSDASILSPRARDLRREDVARLAERGIQVIPWVVDDPAQARLFASWGVAGLVTNQPLRILQALGQEPVRADAPEGDAMLIRNLAAPVLAASLSLAALAPDAPAASQRPRAPELRDVDVVAVYPFTSGGNVDTFCTSLFIQVAEKEEVFRDLIDPYELSITTPDGQPFLPQSMLPALVTEAREKGADALLLGEGKWYDWGFRMEFRLVETEGGTVAWQCAYSSGLSISGPSAKRELVRKAVRDLLRERDGRKRGR